MEFLSNGLVLALYQFVFSSLHYIFCQRDMCSSPCIYGCLEALKRFALYAFESRCNWPINLTTNKPKEKRKKTLQYREIQMQYYWIHTYSSSLTLLYNKRIDCLFMHWYLVIRAKPSGIHKDIFLVQQSSDVSDTFSASSSS